MKRRNFLSGLLAAPLALKARFFARKRSTELCGAPVFRGFVLHDHSARQQPQLITPRERQPASDELIISRQRQVVQLLAEGKSMREAEESFIRNPQGRSHPRSLTVRQREVVQLLAEGKSIRELGVFKVAPRKAGFSPFTYSCSLPRGHKGPHIWLNPR